MSHIKRDDLLDFFWQEYADTFTDDMPYLRYEGPIPVFMFGKYTNFQFMDHLFTENGLSIGKDFQAVSYKALTKEAYRYVNVKNHFEKTCPTDYKSFLLSRGSNIVGFDLTNRQIRGKLYTVSLAGLRLLDSYFYNGVRHIRQKISLEQDKENKDYGKAYTYVTCIGTISQTKGSEIELKNNLQISAPVVVSHSNGKMIYSS